MSSEVIGSFIRRGNFPLEADYIFESEVALKEFYSIPQNQAILHEGLLKVVIEDNIQSLYWVVKEGEELKFEKLITVGDIDDLQKYVDKLIKKLDKEIKDRELADNIIWGTDDPTSVPEDFNSIKKLANSLKSFKEKYDKDFENIKKHIRAVVGTEQNNVLEYLKTLPYESLTAVSVAVHKFLDTVDAENPEISTLPELQKFLAGYTDRDNLKTLLENLYNKILGNPTPDEHFNTLRDLENAIKILIDKTSLRDRDIQAELDNTQRGVGLEPNGNYSPDAYTHYLREATSVMNALRTLDALLYDVITNTNIIAEDTETVDMSVSPYRNETVISAKVKTSSKSGNQIIIESDGIYHNIDFEYVNGRLDILVNGSIVKYFDLGLSGLVSDGYYDTNTENIVIVLSLPGGERKELKVPAGALIEEWEVLNSDDSPIILHKDRNVSGKDTLSANVKISTNNRNILQNKNGQLFVKGTADNIKLNSGETVESKLEDIVSNLNDYSSNINSLRDQLREEVNRAKSSEQELSNKVDTNKASIDNIDTQVSELSKDYNEHKVQVEKDKADLQNQYNLLNQTVENQVAQVNDLSTRVITLEEFKIAHEKDYDSISQQISVLTDTVNQKVDSVVLHKNSDTSYEIFVNGASIGTIEVPEDAAEAMQDLDELKKDVSDLKERDLVEWNDTTGNKAIYLEKDWAISAKFESSDTRTPVLQVLEDVTHVGSNHFPTSLDSSVRPEVNENGTIYKIAYLEDIESAVDSAVKDYISELEARVAKLEQIIETFEWNYTN